MTTGIIVFAHGSRIEPANEAVRAAAAELARAGGYPTWKPRSWNLAVPDLEEAADLLIARGVRQIVVIPYFLTPGTHLERDLPVLVENISNKNKSIQIQSLPRWMATPDWCEILADRARAHWLSLAHSNNT